MGFSIMTTLSIVLPDNLAKASQEVAVKMGISRTQFIRQAILHELEEFQSQLEQEAIVKCFSVMKKDKNYLKDAEQITERLNSDLPDDGDEWWK